MKQFKYKEITCSNPDCGEVFHPCRSDQKHCCQACRMRQNYVRNKPESDRIRKEEIILKKADKALCRLYRYIIKKKTDRVSKELFSYENIEPTLCNVPRLNPATQRPIHFIYNYGFEYDQKGFYIIHKMR